MVFYQRIASILKFNEMMDMKMDDKKSSNYNSCDNSSCKITRRSICHCVILFPFGSYWKESLLVENKSSNPICAKINGEANWIKPKHWVRIYGDKNPRLNDLYTEKNDLSFCNITKNIDLLLIVQ